MARYDFTCEDGHTSEVTCAMADVPPEIDCVTCDKPAQRVFTVPAAIHFRGPGFYSTDVRGRSERRRRANPGDDLAKEFDHGAARIAAGI